MKFQNNLIKISHPDGCSPVNLLHIFRAPFCKNIFERLILPFTNAHHGYLSTKFHIASKPNCRLYIDICRLKNWQTLEIKKLKKQLWFIFSGYEKIYFANMIFRWIKFWATTKLIYLAKMPKTRFWQSWEISNPLYKRVILLDEDVHM